ncbi:MAG TPA: hypothetical protein VNX26_06655 [Candidatus Acidoferrum sp.]|jgi:hypothetical protein|nr:hypothetical protein [Candidatus Acidoferrum sp.]
MSTSPLRPAMVPVTRQMRAYFAPVNRTTEAPTLFDPAGSGVFALDSPPIPWLDLGWIEGFERSYDAPTDVVLSGKNAMPTAQFRGPIEARVEFDFREWGKLQMALAGGSEHMNVLATNPSAAPAPSGGTPIPGVAVLTGSTASELVFGVGAVNGFGLGNLVAVDVDYQQQIGYVGSGISAAYVSNAALVNRDLNYVRRVTFNVGRVVEVTATSVILAQPLLAGTPAAGASAQVVAAFVDREGGSFFQEWSALFVAEAESGGRVCFYYPRLSPNPGAGAGGVSVKSGAGWKPPTGGAGAKNNATANRHGNSVRSSSQKFLREEFAEIARPLTSIGLHASFIALPFTDTNDGQTVLCYRSYFPATMAAVY